MNISIRVLLIAGLLNLAALNVIFIASVSSKCDKGYNDIDIESGVARKRTPEEHETTRPAPPDSNEISTADDFASTAGNNDPEPSYLRWNATGRPPRIPPPDWKFRRPRFCKKATDFRYDEATHGNRTIVAHYHMQHNAGTSYWGMARQFVPCALRSCMQSRRHCMVSYDEREEADHLRRNFLRYGIQFISYEMMLPPRFPMPFVSEEARRGLFFTTIVRDPFQRFLTYVRRHNYTDVGYGEESPFWVDLQTRNQGPYAGDNLNARWLSGAQGRFISEDHINIAKCRLQLFDLVIADELFEHAMKKVICPLNGWRGRFYCNGKIENTEHASKPNPLNGTDPLLVGAWIERLRPSFELYDYARILSWKRMEERGARDLPTMSEVPSHLETLARYTGVDVTDAHFSKMARVSAENEADFRPPAEFCDEMKRVWTGNPDEVPNVVGIGTIAGQEGFMLKSSNT